MMQVVKQQRKNLFSDVNEGEVEDVWLCLILYEVYLNVTTRLNM